MRTSSTCVAKSRTARVIGQLRGLRDADDVERDEHDNHDRAADDVPRVRAQRLPEDREVVRDEERRDGDGDDVDEHLRPGGRERDELVERVPREARRAAGLRVANRAFGVGGSRAGEDHARHDEDDGRQAERIDRSQAERVVDRGADVAVRGGEERRRAEDAFELDLPSASAGHRRSLEQAWLGVENSEGRRLRRPSS